MTILLGCILLSSISFYYYGISYFIFPHIKEEFKRFRLEKIGLFVVLLEWAGATGLWAGLVYPPLLTLSSLGLGVLMLCGLLVRMKFKDSLFVSIPAAVLMILNLFIFYQSWH